MENEVEFENLKQNDIVALVSRDLNLNQETLQRFIGCESLPKRLFLKICTYLKLEPLTAVDEKFSRLILTDLPLARANYYEKIQSQCGKIRILDFSRPIELSNLYVDVNILSLLDTEILISPLSNTDEFNRLGFGEISTERMPGLDAVEKNGKLIIWESLAQARLPSCSIYPFVVIEVILSLT